MRHIPEEELHAYLDQALSRSQCVEIESHLAACPSCQSLRDGIARTARPHYRAAGQAGAPPESFHHRSSLSKAAPLWRVISAAAGCTAPPGRPASSRPSDWGGLPTI